MGNKQKGSQPKFVLTLDNQQIILHRTFNMKITIGEMHKFPHGLDGLKLWDAGIVLSRYIILNSELFKNKTILELGSGVGIAGITASKWTDCSSVTMSDYHKGIIENINKNCAKNECKNIKSLVFDWRQRQGMKEEYDLIMGSDIVYFGCPVKDLYEVFRKLLKKDGRGLIIIPDRKNYAELFVNQINKDEFDLQIEELKNEEYKEGVLQNEKESEYQYSLLKSIKFFAYHLMRK